MEKSFFSPENIKIKSIKEISEKKWFKFKENNNKSHIKS